MNIKDLKPGSYAVVSSNPQSQQQESSPKPIANQITDFFGAKGLTDLAGSQIAKFGLAASGNTDAANRVQQPSMKEVLGSSAQFGANFLPAAGVGAGLLGKAAVGAGTGYAMDVGSKLQQDKSIPEAVTPGIGTAVGTVLPVGGAGIALGGRIMGRLFKGLGSGISGVSTKTLDEMLNNPEVAQQATEKLAKSGNFKVIEDNAKTIVNGVSKIRQEARKAYGEGLAQLKTTDINPQTFRQSIQTFLDKNKVSLDEKTNTRFLDNVEFSEPKNLQKASNLVDELSKVELNGLSLSKLLNKIEDSRFKTATSDERLAFNAFIKDLAESVKGAISGSTNKLGEIKKKFSQDMQLTEAAEGVFGGVDFKNVSEVAKVAKKLESLFNQKGLDPKTTDDFLRRIGIKPEDFRASEAVRQIGNKEPMAPNAPGFNIGEIFRTLTGSLITPENIRTLTIKTGLAQEKLAPFLQSLQVLSSPAQKAVMQALLQNPQQTTQ